VFAGVITILAVGAILTGRRGFGKLKECHDFI
jgi:hypothetical protein